MELGSLLQERQTGVILNYILKWKGENYNLIENWQLDNKLDARIDIWMIGKLINWLTVTRIAFTAAKKMEKLDYF